MRGGRPLEGPVQEEVQDPRCRHTRPHISRARGAVSCESGSAWPPTPRWRSLGRVGAGEQSEGLEVPGLTEHPGHPFPTHPLGVRASAPKQTEA